MMYDQKRSGRLSSLSIENQAAGIFLARSQVVTSVVFPKPAGAEIRVNFLLRLISNLSNKRERRTSSE